VPNRFLVGQNAPARLALPRVHTKLWPLAALDGNSDQERGVLGTCKGNVPSAELGRSAYRAGRALSWGLARCAKPRPDHRKRSTQRSRSPNRSWPFRHPTLRR